MRKTILGKKYQLVDGWDMLTISSDATIPKVYINAKELTLISNTIVGTYLKMIPYHSRLQFASVKNLDEFMFFNQNLTFEEVKFLHSNGYGKFYSDFNSTIQTKIKKYIALDSNWNDLVTNTAIYSSAYRFTFVNSKKNTGLQATDYATSALGLGFDNSTFAIANTTSEIPYSINLWMKPWNNTVANRIQIIKGLGDYNTWRHEYSIVMDTQYITIRYYNQLSAANYKEFKYSIN